MWKLWFFVTGRRFYRANSDAREKFKFSNFLQFTKSFEKFSRLLKCETYLDRRHSKSNQETWTINKTGSGLICRCRCLYSQHQSFNYTNSNSTHKYSSSNVLIFYKDPNDGLDSIHFSFVNVPYLYEWNHNLEYKIIEKANCRRRNKRKFFFLNFTFIPK